MILDYFQRGKNLSISYFDKDGRTKIENIPIRDEQMFNWVLCSGTGKNADTEYTSWNGLKVKKDYSSKTLTKHRLAEIIDDLPEEQRNRIYDYNLPKCYFVDIETEVSDVFPDPEVADLPITVIGIATPFREVIVLGTKQLNRGEVTIIQKKITSHNANLNADFKFSYKYFETEHDMLLFFLSQLVPKFPMMSGWNFIEFDWKYITNRAAKLKIDIAVSSPVKKLLYNGLPAHVCIVDYMSAYSKWDRTVAIKENLKLDQAGYDVLGVQKVKYTGSLQQLYETNFIDYVFYNAIDCCLVELIHEKLGDTNIGCTLTYIAKCPAVDMFSPVVQTESILARNYYKNNCVLEKKMRKDNINATYEGAYVKKPIVGYHRYCICNDFASLYPNIIRELNLSPETFVCKVAEDDTDSKNEWRAKGYIVSESGCIFSKKPGVFSTLVGEVYMKRKSYKKTSYIASNKSFELKEILHSHKSESDMEDAAKRLLKDEYNRPVNENITSYIQKLQTYFSNEYEKYYSWEQGCKIMINSFYGALANKFMYFFNVDLAECITKQGKHAILYAESKINEYFLKKWHNAVDVHKKLGVHVTSKVKKPVAVYIDTDSVYSQLYEIISTTDWNHKSGYNWKVYINFKDGKNITRIIGGGTPEDEIQDSVYAITNGEHTDFSYEKITATAKDFALALDDAFLSDYFVQIFEEYAAALNADNYLIFELESYADAGLWLSKKKYIQNIRWTDSIPRMDIYDNLSKIKAKGIELIQSSTPLFVRKKLKYLITWIFEHDEFDMKDFIAELTKVKKEFKVANIEDLCWNKKPSNYNKFVIDDNKELVLKKGTPITVRGLAFYNYMLNANPKYKNKYNRLKDGVKCKYYYCKNRYSDMFAFEPGMYPIEFAPPIDYDEMFDKTILEPINRIVVAIGYAKLNSDLLYIEKLF